MDYRALAIVLDWVGTILMLGSVWGWMYGKLAPPIKRSLARSQRRFDAMDRLLFGRFDRDERLQRYRRYRERLGVKEDTPMRDRVLLPVANLIWLQQASRVDSKRQEEYQELQQVNKGVREALPQIGRYVFMFFWYETYRALFKIMDSVTSSLFAGRIGTMLFILGFLLWNISKGVSLFPI